MESTFERYEIKYPIRERLIPSISTMLSTYGMKLDEQAALTAQQSYVVTSLYFESPELTSYYDKSGGFLDRQKIRIRIYERNLDDAGDAIFLEQKTKHDMNIKKIRTQITREDYADLIAGNTTQVALRHKGNAILQTIAHALRLSNARPHMVVQYTRTPFVSTTRPFFRITFDTGLRTGRSSDLRDVRGMEKFQGGEAVMELKYNAFLPTWFMRILTAFDLSRDAFSKYALGMETLYRFHSLPR